MGFLDFLLGLAIFGKRNRRNKSEENNCNTPSKGYNDSYINNDCDCGYRSDHNYNKGYFDCIDRDCDDDDGYFDCIDRDCDDDDEYFDCIDRDCDDDDSNEW